MDSLNDILSRRDFDEPGEAKIIKDYVNQKYKAIVSVKVSDREIVITGSSAGLVASLRLQGPAIARRCQTDKRLVFRIG